MNSPRYAPAGLLIEQSQVRVAIDGGPGAEAGPLVAWLVTDECAELIRELRRLAAAQGLVPAGHVPPFGEIGTEGGVYMAGCGKEAALWRAGC